MNKIIQEVMKKITHEYTQSVEKMLDNNADVSDLILEVKKTLDDVGVTLIKEALEITDDVIRDSKSRKESHYIQRRNDPKTLITFFGEVNYQRTYYKNKKTGEYGYLSDAFVGLEPHARIDLSTKAKLVEQSLDLSYQKSANQLLDNVDISDQTVMNAIREIGPVENEAVQVPPKETPRIIYIEADEDHVSIQDGTNKIMKLIYVHEGKELVSKGRYELQGLRYFTGNYSSNEDLWLEVANYIDSAYDMDKVEKIFLSGDGAKWIKEGLDWIKGSEYVLDYFHLSKYVKKATAHMNEARKLLWKHIHRKDKEAVEVLLDTIIYETDLDTKRAAVRECKKYILNNWEGILKSFDKDYIGCSAEGHISHILSARLSSRPLGWSITGADEMARLRVYRANGGNVYQFMKDNKSRERQKKKDLKIDKRVIKKRMRKPMQETMDNVPALNIGRKNWQRQCLKSVAF
ncbi:ISLre2 family transposase [Proteinivorax tanatarense]|uniref:ISLre2 family transposase n=1 Tax=Proteinivorax tanatarense TaxID=1260629 RepID=A0AAU7VN41_9FIRM